MDKKTMINDCYETIEGLTKDIEVLESIIESKRKDITDLMKVVYALEQVNENYIS